jgi:integrase
MVGTVREANVTTITARGRLTPRRQPYWHTIVAGREHLGWQRWPREKAGRWVLRRRRSGNYTTEQIGIADDDRVADGVSTLSFEQARERAVELAASEKRPAGRITVSRAMADYIDHVKAEGRSTRYAESVAATYILPALGKTEVARLTSKQLSSWLAAVADQPARKRARAGRPQFRSAPQDEEEGQRRRRSSANRVLAVLKAALNYAFDEGHVASNNAWGRRVKKFKGVDAARERFLSTDEAVRLINASDPDFRLLVRAALETGARYGELGRLKVADFNVDVGDIHVRKTKTSKARHVRLTPEGAAFFSQVCCAGRAGGEIMLLRSSGLPWRASDQGRPMAEACRNARIEPLGIHQLRHTWASHAVMNGVPLMVVARNLGHVDTKQVERHYGHLAESFITKAIRDHAPRFPGGSSSNVEPLKVKGSGANPLLRSRAKGKESL